MNYASELQNAVAMARAAGAVILEHYQSFQAIPNARADISTEADRASQETILREIRRLYPYDRLCAEEATPTLAASPHEGGRLWIIDPIDGTRGFAMKNGEFSVMIGLIDQDGIALGVVYEPALDRLTWAACGLGCWKQDGGGPAIRCTVSAVRRLQDATLVQSHSRPDKPKPAAVHLRPAHILETYSAGIKLAKVARGEADLYLNDYDAFHDWDICAGHILVEEAGGQVTGLAGDRLTYGTPGAWQRSGLLASNGQVHADALAKWRNVG